MANYRLAAVDNGTSHRDALGAEFARDVGDNTISLRGLAQYRRQHFSDNDQSDEDFVVCTRLELQRAMASRLDHLLCSDPLFTSGNGAPSTTGATPSGMKVEYMKGANLTCSHLLPGRHVGDQHPDHIVGVYLDFNGEVRRKPAGS